MTSRRADQGEAKQAELITRWTDEHDGDDPSPRTIARLERQAVLASRPAKAKQHIGDHEALRSEWVAQAREAGFAPLTLPPHEPTLPGTVHVDEEAVIAQALEAVAVACSTWIEADLAREIAARIPAEAAASA